jgi:hypothetical protein
MELFSGAKTSLWQSRTVQGAYGSYLAEELFALRPSAIERLSTQRLVRVYFFMNCSTSG